MARLIAISTVRNEMDIVAHTFGHLLAQGVDRLVVADNLSSDGTLALLLDLAADRRVAVEVDSDPAHRQAAKMTALAARYAAEGDWVVPVDGDELWSGLEALRGLEADEVRTWPYVQVPTGRDDPADPNPVTRTVCRQPGPEPNPKVCFRWRAGCRLDEGNHRVFGAGPLVVDGAVEVRHFQYRSFGQVRRKVREGTAALDAAGVGPGFGTHWRELAAKSDAELAAWWDDYRAQPVVEDPAVLLCRLSQR